MTDLFNWITKNLSHIYLATLALLISATWPLAILFIYLTDRNLFQGTDVFKLTLLSAAPVTPVILLNTLLLYLVVNPLNPELRQAQRADKPLDSAFLFGTIFTSFILFLTDISAMFQSSQNNIPVCFFVGLETLLIGSLAIVVWKERSEPN